MNMNNGVQTVAFLVGMLCLALIPMSKCQDAALASSAGYVVSSGEGTSNVALKTKADVTGNSAAAKSEFQTTGDAPTYKEGVIYAGASKGSDYAETGGIFAAEGSGGLTANIDAEAKNRGTSTKGSIDGESLMYFEGELLSSASKQDGRRLKVAL